MHLYMDGPIPNAIGTPNTVCTFSYAKEKKSKKTGNLNLSTKMNHFTRKSVYAVNEGTVRPGHLRSLNNAIFIRFLDGIGTQLICLNSNIQDSS